YITPVLPSNLDNPPDSSPQPSVRLLRVNPDGWPLCSSPSPQSCRFSPLRFLPFTWCWFFASSDKKTLSSP
ncbi:hypothetical protein LINPERHAP2_LOCUS39544, partial [Linum perenne]